ncbi:uncharacterized protein [Procambarus clarkii]|uniref:uncharacterized protein n=1 Tax=Procambarus clarkii TaxID=6728 RepID=UPI001E67544F|nr:uncharacterized protein LOC123774062 [Procambarus clarkii]
MFHFPRLVISLTGLLTGCLGSPINDHPARLCNGSTSVPCQHTGTITHHLHAPPLSQHFTQGPHLQGQEVDARGESIQLVVGNKTDANENNTIVTGEATEMTTPVTPEEQGSDVLNDGEEASNSTRLDMELKGVSLPTKTSGQQQEETNFSNTTLENSDPSQNVTLALHALNDTEVVNSNKEVENIVYNIISENGEQVGYQNSTSSSSFNIYDEAARDRDGRRIHDDTLRQEESSVIESDSYINTDFASKSLKEENSTIVKNIQHSDGTAARKCCGLDEFFSLATQQCEAAKSMTGFPEAVRDLLEEESDLTFIPGRLQACPGTSNVPTISEASFHTHSILSLGHLKDHTSGITYDHDHYCLEVAAPGPDQLATGILVAAFCYPWPTEIHTRKCCNLNEYYNHANKGYCMRSTNMSDHENLVREFSKNNPRAPTIQVSTGRLNCSHGEPRIVIADQAFLDHANQLCERDTGDCYPSSLYCIEYLWAEGYTTMTPVAFVCPLDSFHKCCPRDHILTESGCVEASGGYVSARMLQLLEVMEPQFGFPTEIDGGQCVQEWITPNDSEIRWWISKSGYLKIDVKTESHSTMRYCVDDYLDPVNETQTVALMCITELDDIVPVHLSAQPSEAGSVGKCCPHDQYMDMDSYTCITDSMGLSLLQDPLVHAANITKLTYTSFPTCENGEEYHFYYIDPGSFDDHGELVESQVLEVVSLEGRCVLSRQAITRENYCLEYGVVGSNINPVVLVCPEEWNGMNVHREKFGLTAVLLGLSCTALFATAFSLISTRVRRGLVTVKKVNTLAGKILLSYVLSYLVGFLLLAVNMKVEVAQDNTECQAMAGLLTFFLLAAFQWNTSICLESLLLTLRVSTSERWRYVLHSVWAWGVPGVVTCLALTLDHYRHSLPCGVITPRVGLYRCFFSDQNAKLVYLYVPMLMSLCANVLLLAAARYVRSAKLRRLEHGNPKSKSAGTEAPEESQNSSAKESGPGTTASHHAVNPQHSGLRTHQTRNLWTESVKLVVWSGATWLLEVIAFVVAEYMVKPSESWYDYLWYVPSSVNALRGVGIFYILVLTPENRVKLVRAIGNFGGSLAVTGSLARSLRPGNRNSSIGNHRSSVGGESRSEVRGPGRRNMSIATTITQFSSISSSHSHDSRADTASGRTTVHPRVAHSISQVDTRRSSTTSMSSDFEGFELDAEISAGGRRKSSLATFGVVSLPSVDEEDVFEEATPSHTALNVTKSTSDA